MTAPSAVGRSARTQLMALLGLAFLLRVAMAAWFPNVHHADEIFQTLEPATRLTTGTGIVSWEWREGIRSWMFPGFISGLMTFFGAFTDSRAALLLAISATLSLLSLSVVAVGYHVGERTHGPKGGLLVGALCAFWPDLVYFAPKTLTEAVAAHILIGAAFLAVKVSDPGERPSANRLIVLGLLLGLAFCLRFHLAFAMLAIAIWVCRTDWRGRWLPLVAGAAVPVLAFGLADLIAWGTPFQSVWKNLWINVVEGRSHRYGTSPFYWYVLATASVWRLAVVPLGITFLAGARSLPLFALCAVLIWLSHTGLAHKELRFVYPAIPFIVILAGVGTLHVIDAVAKVRATWSKAALTSAAAAWAAIAFGVGVSDGFRPRWTGGGNILAAQAAVRGRQDLCGLGIVGVEWWRTGGYTHLGRRVPIYLHFGAAEPVELSPEALTSFNYAIAPAPQPVGGPFMVDRCWGEICLHRRDGGCATTGPGEANRHLVAIGE